MPDAQARQAPEPPPLRPSLDPNSRDEGKPGEALICTPLKELVAQLDPNQFAQVHRSVVVNLRAISHVKRGLNETADIHLKGRDEVLPVSRGYVHLFRQM